MARELNLEHTYCSSKTCPKKDQCGNHISRIKGEHWICWQCDFEPDADGKCSWEEPFEEITVPNWINNLADDIQKERKQKENQNGRS